MNVARSVDLILLLVVLLSSWPPYQQPYISGQGCKDLGEPPVAAEGICFPVFEREFTSNAVHVALAEIIASLMIARAIVGRLRAVTSTARYSLQ